MKESDRGKRFGGSQDLVQDVFVKEYQGARRYLDSLSSGRGGLGDEPSFRAGPQRGPGNATKMLRLVVEVEPPTKHFIVLRHRG